MSYHYLDITGASALQQTVNVRSTVSITDTPVHVPVVPVTVYVIVTKPPLLAEVEAVYIVPVIDPSAGATDQTPVPLVALEPVMIVDRSYVSRSSHVLVAVPASATGAPENVMVTLSESVQLPLT